MVAIFTVNRKRYRLPCTGTSSDLRMEALSRRNIFYHKAKRFRCQGTQMRFIKQSSLSERVAERKIIQRENCQLFKTRVELEL